MFFTSESTSQHLDYLELLFQRLRDHNVMVNFEKSHFIRPEVKLLRPRNIQELIDFLGIINYYTKFTNPHAQEIVPFLKLLRVGSKCIWDLKKEDTF